jgi:hypothetical protein
MPWRKGFVSPKVIIQYQQLQYFRPAVLGKFEGCVRYALSVTTLKLRHLFSHRSVGKSGRWRCESIYKVAHMLEIIIIEPAVL